jgi:hypothetical protein
MSAERTVTELADRIKSLSGNWATYSVVGSFLLYLFGYLTIRFYLTAFGLATDLAVLDERYIFAGARFLVYLVSTATTLVLLGLLSSAVGYLPYRWLRRRGRGSISSWWQRSRWSAPDRLIVIGIVFSVAVIQLLMKQCFFFNNLLLSANFPRESPWLADLLLSKNEKLFELYFSGLIVAALLSIALLIYVASKERTSLSSRFLFGVFAFLVTAQILLLPVNYGYLLADKYLPRVATLDGEKPLGQNEHAWLVWEGKDGLTFLLRRGDGSAARSLVTIKQKDVKKTEIIGYDRILTELFVKP